MILPSRGKASEYLFLLLSCVTIIVAVLAQGFTTDSFSVLQILQLSVLFLCLWQGYYSGITYQVSYSLLLILLLLYLGVSSMINPVNYNGLTGFFHFFSLFAWYVILLNAPGREQLWRNIQRLILLLGILTAVYALYQIIAAGLEPKAFFAQQNSCAAFLNLAIFMALAYLYCVASNDRLLCIGSGALTILLYFSLFLIGGRGAILGHLAGLAVLCICLYRVKKYRTICLFVSLAVSGLILSGLQGNWKVGTRFLDLGQDIVQLEALGPATENVRETGSSVSERWIIWNSSLKMLGETPWYGSGFGSFHMRYPAFQHYRDTSSGQYAHNDYIQLLIETGYPGFLLFMALLLYILSRFFVLVNNNSSGIDRKVEGAALFAGFISISVHSLFSYNFYILPLLIVVSIYLARLMFLCETIIPRTLSPSRVIGKNIYFLVTGGLWLFLVMVFISNVLMNRSYEQGREFYANNDFTAAESRFARAERFFNTENIQIARALLYLSAAESFRNKRDMTYKQLMEWGMEHLDQAERMNPWQAQVNYVRGLFYREYGSRMSEHAAILAKREFEIALIKNRRHNDARLALARMYKQEGDLNTALAVLEEGLIHPLPNSPAMREYLETLVKLRRDNGFEKAADELENRLQRLEAGWDETGKRENL